MARRKRSAQAADTQTRGASRDLAALWSTEYGRFQASRSRIRIAGQWRRNEVDPIVPWANGQSFMVKLPHATTMGQAVVAFLSRRRPQVHREPLGSDPRAERISSRIENWLQPLLEDVLQAGGENLFDAFLSFAVHDGEFGLLVQPDLTHWDEMLEYTVEEGGVDVIAPRFQRDSKGRAPDDPYYGKGDRSFSVDKAKSAAAFKDYELDAKSREVPFVVRILPAEMCIPIGIDPQTGKVDALLIRSDRTAISLKRDGFDCLITGPGVAATQLSALGSSTALSGAGTLFSLYELWIVDDEGCKVFYQVGSAGTTSRSYDTTRDGKDAVLDLAAKYPGFYKDIPGGYFKGCHFENETDINKSAYPFIYPFLSLLGGSNQTLSSKNAHMYLTAFGGWNARLSTEDVNTWVELGRPVDVEVKPGKVNFITGELTPAVHPGTGKDVDEFLQLALNVLRELGPQGTSPSSDQSGFAQAVSISSSDAAYGQLTRCATMATRRTAGCLLEACAALSIETGGPIPVYAQTDAKTGRKQDHVELSAEDLDGDYEVDINLPTPRFNNIALAQSGAQWVESGLIPQSMWLEEMLGIEQPEKVADELWVERQLASPEGQQYVLQLAAKYSGEQGLQEIQRMMSAGKVGPGGTPTAAMPPRPGMAGTGQDGAGGPNTGSPAQAAVAGMIAGQSMTQPQSRVVAATGQPAAVSG